MEDEEGLQGCVQTTSLSNFSAQDEIKRNAYVGNVNCYMTMVSSGNGLEKVRNDENEDRHVSDSDYDASDMDLSCFP